MAQPKNLMAQTKQAIAGVVESKLPISAIYYVEFKRCGCYASRCLIGLFETRKINDDNLIAMTKSYFYTDLHHRIPKDRFRTAVDYDSTILVWVDGDKNEDCWGRRFEITVCHTLEELFNALFNI